MAESLRCTVPAPADGQPLVAWLVSRFRYFDEPQWSAQVAAGRVHRNGHPAEPAATIRAGDTIAYFPAPAAGPAAAEVPVLHADLDLLVVDKPPHRVVQHVGAFAHATFVAALAERFPPGAGAARLEPVHRLDRETSGVLVLSRTLAATRALQRQFEAGGVGKQYVAVVHGVVAAACTIDAPIGRSPTSAIAARFAVVAAGSRGARAACTEVAVECRLPQHTVVRLHPRTGRTHQLRVHLEHLGHPIVGDKLYGRSDGDYLAWVDHLKADGDPRRCFGKWVERQLLHAERLVCRHPRDDAEIAFTAKRPRDLADFVDSAAARPAGSPR